MENELDKERLGKIVALAKSGIGGEKLNAIRIVKALCKKHNLDFDDVMENITIKEFSIRLNSKEETDIFAYCFLRYGLLQYKDHYFGFVGKTMYFKTTAEKYIELMNAYPVLLNLYRKEKAIAVEAIQLGFRNKHRLYYDPTPEEWEIIKKEKEMEKKKTKAEQEKERKLREMADGISRGMDNANIYKQLK